MYGTNIRPWNLICFFPPRNNNFIIAFCWTQPSVEGRWFLFVLMQLGSWSTLLWKPHSHLRGDLLKGQISSYLQAGVAEPSAQEALPCIPLHHKSLLSHSSNLTLLPHSVNLQWRTCKMVNSCHWWMLRCTSSMMVCWSMSISQANWLKACNQRRNKGYGRKTTSHSTWNLGVWPPSRPHWGPVLLSYSILLTTVEKPKTPPHSPWTYGSGYCRDSVKSSSCIKHLPFEHAKIGHLNAKEGCAVRECLKCNVPEHAYTSSPDRF